MNNLLRSETTNEDLNVLISLRDILIIMFRSYLGILACVLTGICGSLLYLHLTPKIFEGTAHIALAKYSFDLTLPIESNLEDLDQILYRSKLPSFYYGINLEKCGLANENKSFETINSAVKFSSIKGNNSFLVMKVQLNTKEFAKSCMETIFDEIKSMQESKRKVYIENAEKSLKKIQNDIAEIRNLLFKSQNSGEAITAIYLSNREQLASLNNEAVKLKSFIQSSEVGQARLVSPIHVLDKPISPNKISVLLIGLFIGLTIGVLFSLIKNLSTSKTKLAS